MPFNFVVYCILKSGIPENGSYVKSTASLGYVNIGRSPRTSDVISKGTPSPMYAGIRKVKEEHVFPRSLKEVRFFINIPATSKRQSYQPPEIRGSHLEKVCNPELSGQASYGGTLQGGDNHELLVNFHCRKNAVGFCHFIVQVPLNPRGSSRAASFRLRKECGNIAALHRQSDQRYTCMSDISLFWCTQVFMSCP